MHSTLLNKPIGVIMSFLALLIFSVLALVRLPVSLLPDIESPSIIIRVNQPEMGVWEMEENILKPIRERMITVNHLRDLRSEASGGEGRIYLTFDFDAPMNLAYIEVNEKIDLLTNQLPRHVDRPHVVKVNSTDIPVLKVHLIPKNQEQFAELSEFAGKVIKKRFEQLDGVALVDINGLRGKEIRIVPDKQKLSALGLSPDAVIHALSVINRDISTVSIKEGQYRYFLKITSAFTGLQDIKNTAIPLANGQHVSLQEISSVEEVISSPRGLHVFNSEEGMVIHIHKRPSARLLSLRDDLYREVDQMKMEYTDFTFSTSSDQSLLLSLSIENLTQSLLYGGLFAFLILFLFMGNFRLSMIIGISLPVSLLISFLFFYLFNISLNIISLSGLALGIGMLIDNSIIVIDNISGKLSKGETLDRAVLLGTGEVMTALLSSVLTTLAVFVPLIFLSGISGALFYDQAMAIAIILGISLIVSFLLIPVLYKKLMGNRNPSLVKSDSKGFLFLRSHYDNFFRKVVKRPKTTLLILFVLLLLFYVGAGTLSMEGMPPVKKSEVELSIDWGEPITLEKNRERVHLLVKAIDNDLESYHADLGTLQYLLNTKKATIQTA
ncbi:MAG: efflux RND transporter permease subunit, partial [Cyclobacteriaceae bacterium]|nr:efflux RND transporter permease subunit [Cyclobacteriaceae bacterium]